MALTDLYIIGSKPVSERYPPFNCIDSCRIGYNKAHFKPWLVLGDKLRVCGNYVYLFRLGLFLIDS